MTIITQSSKLKTQNDSSNLKTDLRVRTYGFSVNIIKTINRLPETVSSRIIFKQLLRAATSVGANVIEAKSSSSRRDFINYYSIALKSSNETKYWLALLQDACNINNNDLSVLVNEINEISNMLAASIITLKRKNRF
jgi:four helix bundle protein